MGIELLNELITVSPVFMVRRVSFSKIPARRRINRLVQRCQLSGATP